MDAADELVFHVIPQGDAVPSQARFQAFLNRDRWDDWGKFCTQFYLTFVDAAGNQHRIGTLKIGQEGLKPDGTGSAGSGHRRPAVPPKFKTIEETCFSLGQDEEYYEKIGRLGDAVREQLLKGLRDVAFNPDLWLKVRHEDVTQESLLRSVTSTTVEGPFRRMAQGGARLTPYRFVFVPPKRMGGGKPPFELEFSVVPESKPPTNVHVLIGRNGVGKTRLLVFMTKALVGSEAAARQSGNFAWEKGEAESDFSNLVTVSFSAFDQTELPLERDARAGRIKYSYIGLRRAAESSPSSTRLKSDEVLTTEFVRSLGNCQIGPLRRRWLAALGVLDSDPVFKAAILTELITKDLEDKDERAEVTKIFGLLSSGHKIVLLTLTRLVETVEEKTLVLVDEPEAHLHPPLLSAFVRALSNLLVDRNGVAIIATHSPVVLQEVPKTCVWILSRIITQAKAERPSMETFGENVSILTREVFQLELSQSGFHRLLEEAVRTNSTYEAAVDSFDGQLGAEARAVLKAMLLEKRD